jgi:hypothetical protein
MQRIYKAFLFQEKDTSHCIPESQNSGKRLIRKQSRLELIVRCLTSDFNELDFDLDDVPQFVRQKQTKIKNFR